jgi:hypothetical protein
MVVCAWLVACHHSAYFPRCADASKSGPPAEISPPVLKNAYKDALIVEVALPEGAVASFEISEYSPLWFTWRKIPAESKSPGIFRLEGLNQDTVYCVRVTAAVGADRRVSTASARMETLTASAHEMKTRREYFEAQKESSAKLTADYNA